MSSDNQIPADADRPENDGASRRSFLRHSIIASASALFLPQLVIGGMRRTGGACDPTTPDILGPYWEPNSPTRTWLMSQDEPGERLTIQGMVLARDCSPLAGVTVDVWGANDAGCYIDLNSSGNPMNTCSPATTDKYNLRGRVLTNAQGAYEFTTIKPGRYLNGAQYRPSHLHFRVTAPGEPPFVTQLYFEGDPFNSIDPWAGDPTAAKRIIPLEEVFGRWLGNFDITLDVATASVDSQYGAVAVDRCDLAGGQPNPFTTTTTIGYSIPAVSRVGLQVFDLFGRQVRTLVDSVHGIGAFNEVWDGCDDAGVRLPAGSYVVRLSAGGYVDSRQVLLID